MPNIFITGDSWGVKEWTPENCNDSAEEMDRAAHRGLETYLRQDGFAVHNLSSGGSSNKESIDRLIAYIDKEQLYNRKIDHVFWIITDPIRDLRPYNDPPKKLSYELTVNNGYNNLIKKLFREQCSRANSLAEERGIKINLLGGVASFNKEELAPYKNLTPLVPSWYDLLLSKVEKKMVPDRPIWTSQTSDVHIDDIDLAYIKQAGGDKLAKQVVDEFWEISEFHRIVHNSNYFFRLDHSHPDRHGHKLLYENIWEKLKLR